MKKAMLVGSGLLAVSLSGQAAELFLTINSGSPMTQGAALVLASQAIEQKPRYACCCVMPVATSRSSARTRRA